MTNCEFKSTILHILVEDYMIINEVKKVLLDLNISMTELASAMGKKLNKPYSLSNLSGKLRKETITYKEMKLIAEILGYDLKLTEK
jgi:hypothetical protein